MGRESPVQTKAYATLEAQALDTAMWLIANRPGICLVPPAENIVIDCLRALQALPHTERMDCDPLMDGIARVFLDTAFGVRNHKRRCHALLKLSGERA